MFGFVLFAHSESDEAFSFGRKAISSAPPSCKVKE